MKAMTTAVQQLNSSSKCIIYFFLEMKNLQTLQSSLINSLNSLQNKTYLKIRIFCSISASFGKVSQMSEKFVLLAFLPGFSSISSHHTQLRSHSALSLKNTGLFFYVCLNIKYCLNFDANTVFS